MDIILKENEDDTMDIYWMIRQAYHYMGTEQTDRRFRDGSCKVCGCKE